MLLTWVSSVVVPCAKGSENEKLLELLDTVGLVDTIVLNPFIQHLIVKLLTYVKMFFYNVEKTSHELVNSICEDAYF